MESTLGITPEEVIEAPFGPFQRIRIICLDSRLDVAMSSERNISTSLSGYSQPRHDIILVLHQNPTFEHVQQELATQVPEWTVLQPIYGPNPYWKHADQNSPIGVACRSLYAIDSSVRYILAVVRTAQSDRPLPIFDTQETIIKAIIVANPDLENQIESFTCYSKVQDARTERFDYDRLQEREHLSFPTTFILTLHEPPQEFRHTVSSATIPPFLQIPFVNCKNLLRSTYNLEFFPLQMIHVSSALLHAIICLAEAFKLAQTKNTIDPHSGDVLEVALALADELNQFLDSLAQIAKHGGEEGFNQANTLNTINQTFIALCGDYPGAVNIRRSSERFEELKELDREEAELSNPTEAVRTVEEGPFLPISEQHELVWGSDTIPVETARTAKEKQGEILADPAPVIPDIPAETVRIFEKGQATTPVEGYHVGEEGLDSTPAERVPEGTSQSFTKKPGDIGSQRRFLRARLEEVRAVTVGAVDEGPVTNPVDAAFKEPDSHDNTNVPLIATNLSPQTIDHENITGDNERAISEYRTALETTIDGSLNKPMLLNRLAICLESRFRQSDSVDDLQEAASSLQTAVELTPDGHQAKPALLTNLGNVLQTRSARVGDLADLERVISSLKNAAELTPDGHPNKPSLLYSLGSTLLLRFRRLGDLDDLNQAISFEQAAVELTSDDYLDRHTLIDSVGNVLRVRFERTGDLGDIEKAIASLEIATDLTPDGHPEKPSRLSSLGAAFQSRFERLGNLADREKSISFLEKAVELTPGSSGQPINNGIYNITNVHHGRLVYLADPNDSTPLQGYFRPGNRNAHWHVRYYGNEQYSIENVEHNRYADSGDRAMVGAYVEGSGGARLWRIQALPTGKYTIATTDTRNLWMLPSDIVDTPVELFNVYTDRRCWWTFTKLTNGDTDTVTLGQIKDNAVQQAIDSNLLPMSTGGGVDKRMDKGVRILSLDSGGPGTYSQLLLIKEYMVRLASDLGIDETDVYPADYFDLMGGVGFGGLVAILLGHLRMQADAAIDALLDVASAIFPGDSGHNYDLETNTRQLKESVENILQTRGIPVDRKMQGKGKEPVVCKVALYAATTANLSHPIALRTYRPRGSSLNPTIVEAICATMATPSYFSPISIGPLGLQQTFVGGPHGANNPTRELLGEANAIFGKDKLVVQVVSLGCGRSHVSSVERFTNIDEELAMDCEIVEKELSAKLYDVDAYLRLNVDRGMGKLLMREWHQLGPIEAHTNAYVESPAISEIIEASLRRLQGGHGTVTLGQINHPNIAKDSEDSHVLERLKPVDDAGYSEGRGCMEGTRTALLEYLLDWSLKPSAPPNGSNSAKMYWLYGPPGLGKTSIANSLCNLLHRNRSLGGSFFCRREDPILRDPTRILPTLVAKLAGMSAPYKRLVVKALKDDPQLNPHSKRGEVLLSLLQSVKEIPPHSLVLVVDAFDECGDQITRKELLTCLFEACSHVSWITIIITSRPEHDIQTFFKQNQVDRRDLAEDDQAADDILLFTRRHMASIAGRHYLPTDWPGEERLKQISNRSGGLFIYVETVSRFVDDPDPEPLLSAVLAGGSGEANTELDKLYSMVILLSIGMNKEKFRLLAQAIVTVATYRPLPDETLASLTGLESGVVRSWVDRLGAILYRDASTNGGIRVRHVSVIKFLTGPACPEEFRVVLGQANEEMGIRCLTTMAKELKFNICELETSCVLNADIPDLDNRLQDKISDALQYSSMYWSSHLCSDSAPASIAVSKQLGAFFRGTQWLYWVEVMSLMGKVPVAIASMRLMKAFFKKFEDRHQHLVEDALGFLLAFFAPISNSTPHIYISALPFMPMGSYIWKLASVSFPEMIDVYKGRAESWLAPSSIWDVQTGAAVGQPLPGHSGTVWSVTYSPDGRNIVSGSDDRTIRIWDAQIGAAVGEPLRGHTEAIFSVAYSPDCRNIASGSSDRTIRIWDAHTGAAVGQPLTGHSGIVWNVTYSPDGRNIVSGSEDRTIQIWDAQIGAAVGEPLRGHTEAIFSVAYSPDGRNIVSGSEDRTIRIWDAHTGAAAGQPLTGHSGIVWNVTYSPDGRNIVSGSEDRTIRIWDAQIGAAVGEPLRGHTEAIFSVAYSPDGRNIVSGSSDRTIRIWDAQIGAAVGQPLTGHSDYVRSIAYSPDGRSIVSGSYDRTIRIWDAQTGMDEDRHGVGSHPSYPETNHLSLTTLSGRAIPITWLGPDGWVRGTEGLLFWVPEDCRKGLTSPVILTIPPTGPQRPVRIDFTRFQYGTSWTNIRGVRE